MTEIEYPWRDLAAGIVVGIGTLIFIIMAIVIITLSIQNYIKSKQEQEYGSSHYYECTAADYLKWGISFVVIFIGCLVGFICFLVSYSNKLPIYNEWNDNYHEEIVYNNIYSVTRESETTGHFVLGYGSVNTDTYYYFYVKKNTDTYQLTKLKIDNNVYIKEVDSNYNIMAYNDKNSTTIYYYINVPKGTIIQSYNI